MDRGRLMECVRANAKVGRAVSTYEASQWLDGAARHRRAAAGLAKLRSEGIIVSARSDTRPLDVYWTTAEEVGR